MSNGVSLDDLLQSSDELAQGVQLFRERAGRQKSPDAVECLTFAELCGCGDLVRAVMRNSQYMLSSDEIRQFQEVTSRATANKEMIQFGAQQRGRE
jgi:hypothetical protein